MRILIIAFLIFLFVCTTKVTFGRGVNGGMSCAVCTVLVGIAKQVAEVHEETILNATTRLCNYLPEIARQPCLEITTKLETSIIDSNIAKIFSPDMICLLYGTCTVEDGEPLCHLFPLPFEKIEIIKKVQELKEKEEHKKIEIDVCKLPVIKDICNILNNSYNSLRAAEDFDKDGFSLISTARGSDWKGKDCRDNDPNSYPGRLPYKVDIDYDSNCNGIWGMDNLTNKPWEEILCSEHKPRGLLYIGDSIGAHFHLPQMWINPINFSLPNLNVTNIILDELDWPQHGFATGFKNITPNVLIKGRTDSIYLKLKARNRCNHRDYQNLSQNGASSYNSTNHINSLSRNKLNDYPAIVIYGMLGNDVCNNFKDTISNMTPPHIFRKNVMEALRKLNMKLPNNSHVILIGLVNADFIFPAMAERVHPIGKLHNNVFYKDMYNWFNCLQIGPCTGWLNANITLRKLTTKKAIELTEVLQDIAINEKFESFNIHYIENPINIAVKQNSVNISQLLEAADSLHPNQLAQPIIADILWNKMLNNLPSEVLGPINPKNDLIERIFGDQGGY